MRKVKQLELFNQNQFSTTPPPDPSQLEFLLINLISNNPGITTEKLCEQLNLSPSDIVPILRGRLLKKGKIQDLGWALPDVSLHHDKISGDRPDEMSLHHDTKLDGNEPSLHHDKFIDDSHVSLHHDKISGDRLDKLSLHHDKDFFLDASLHHDSFTFTEKPRIVWLRPGGRDTPYPWFQCGKRRVYIGGGPIGSSVAESRVSQIRAWIDQGLSAAEICDRIQKLKTEPKMSQN